MENRIHGFPTLVSLMKDTTKQHQPVLLSQNQQWKHENNYLKFVPS